MVVAVGTEITHCTAEGNQYPVERPFSFTEGCFRFNCECYSNGSWNCPSDRSEHICPLEPGERIIRGPGKKMTIVMSDNVQACIARGNEYFLGQPFTFTEGCFKYYCECHVDGSWECDANKAEDICNQQRWGAATEDKSSNKKMTIVISNNRLSCVAKGKEYALGQPFSFTEGCFRYHCDCRSDGSWECPADRAEVVCGEEKDRTPTGSDHTRHTSVKTHTRTKVIAVGTQLSYCMIEGTQHSTGRPFSFDEGCFRFNCDCHSDGSWECPSERAEYICQLQPGQEITRGPSKRFIIVVSSNVRACVVSGNEYTLGRQFSFMDGCIKYKCQCHSDGSWECPADTAEDTCQHGQDGHWTIGGYQTGDDAVDTRSHTRTMVVAIGTQLSHCTVDGNEYPTERPFSFTEGCFRFNCVCNSDGSWECPSERSEYICPLKPGQIVVRGPSKKMTIVVSNATRFCTAKGREYPLGQAFSFVEGCFQYNCECHSDGSWDCPGDKAENICRQHGQTEQPTVTERKSHTRSMVIPVGTQLKFCTAQGNKYPLGQPFSFTDECFRFNCDCHRDGSWECPSEKSQYTCPLKPGKRIVRGPSKSMIILVSNKLDVCTVRGEEYSLNQPFSFSDGCYTYRCECHSDGSWDCPADQAVDRCGHTREKQPTEPETTEQRTASRSIVVGLGTNIRSCLVNEIHHALGSTFSFEDNCFRYICECHMDGSWECPGDLAEYICQQPKGQVTRVSTKSFYVIIGDNVRSCSANGNEYPLGLPFQYIGGCFRYRCQCHSDGSWECPADSVEDTCQHTSNGQQTTRKTTRRSHTKSIVVAVGTQLEHCLAEGNQYTLGRSFFFTEGCFRFNCDCHSDGSWECPSERSEYICQLQPGQKIVRAPSKSMRIVARDNAKSCLVKGSEYDLGQSFSFTEGCFIYNCECHTDGSWECPADRAVDRCRRTIEGQPSRGGIHGREENRNRTSHTRSLVVSVGTEVKNCIAQEMHFTLGEPFSFREGCFKFNCFCHLNGSWDCPAEKSEYKCKLEPGQQIVRAPSKSMKIVISDDVRACTANGIDYPLGQPFSFMDGCFIFNCDCHPDGSWECPQDRAVDRCRRTTDGGQRNRGRVEDTIDTVGVVWMSVNLPIALRGQVVVPGSAIRSCELKGKTYALDSTFSFTEDCYLYKCTCNRDGSWNCPGNLAEYSCPRQPGHRTVRVPSRGLRIIVGENLKTCTVKRVEHDLGRVFVFNEGCFAYNCICHSDGSWECPVDQTVDRCRFAGESQHGTNGQQMGGGGESREQTSHTRSVVVSVGTEIKYCIAQEMRFTLGQPFSFREGCFEFHCECHQNGSWDCPAERSEYKCKPEPGQQIVRAPSKSMKIVISDDVRACTTNGIDYPLGQPFSFMDGCFIFNCDCHPDGSWECPQDRAVDRCRRTPDGGQRNRGREEDTNSGQQTNHGQHRGGEDHETSWESTNKPVSPSLGYSPDRSRPVLACTNNGVDYPLGLPFSFTRDCFKYNCECHTDGSWECPSEKSEYTCSEDDESQKSTEESSEFETLSSGNIHRSEATMCTADGKKYPLNQAFSFTVGCYRYNCECRKDGSWECPGHRVENTCRSLEGHNTGQVKRRNIQVVISKNLRTCTVKGVEFPLDHAFSFTDNCVKYNCHCFFDGSWDCPPERIEHACPTSGGRHPQLIIGPRLQRSYDSPLRSCVVEGVEYAAGSSFNFKAFCYNFECQCFIDGSWECPASKAEFICRDIPSYQYSTNRTTGERFSSQGLVISPGSTPMFCSAYGLYHKLNQSFIVTHGCFRLRCYCHLDGSWDCPSHQAIYFCPTNSRQVHRTASRSLYITVSRRPMMCQVKGRQYPLGQPFLFMDGCFKYHCMCNIDGSWVCPSKRTEDICPSNSTEESRMHRASAVHGLRTRQQSVWFCMVKGTRYPIGQPFTYTDGCFRYNCDCRTDGSWNCPAHKSQNICQGQSRTDHRTQQTGCVRCTVKGVTYRSLSRFHYMEGCIERHCTCNCDGTYDCPMQDAVSRCHGCIDCMVEGVLHRGHSHFKRTKDCVTVDCSCYCNGTFECFDERKTLLPCAENIPIGGNVGNGKPTPPTPITLSGTMPTLIFTDRFLPPGITRKQLQPTVPPTLSRPIPIRPNSGDALTAPGNLSVIVQHESIGNDTRIDFTTNITLQGRPSVHTKDRSRHTETKKMSRTDVRVVNTTGRNVTVYEPVTHLQTTPRRRVEERDEKECKGCNVYTKYHEGNTTFKYIEGCYEYLCTCYCDSSWTCPDDQTVNTCETQPARCNSCIVDGRSYRGNSTFIYKVDDCIERTCKCNCDGSYTCPANETANVCVQKPRCKKCSVREQLFDPNTDFTLQQGCLRYHCKCNCDGGWNCPADATEDICQVNPFPIPESRCIRCNARGIIAEPNTNFELQQGCIKYKCFCKCDGGWNCPGESAVDICNTDPETGCQYCDVRGKREKGHSRFELTDGCWKYQCICNCNGSWNCPKESAVYTCETIPRCYKCNARGSIYEPNTRFSLQEECFKYQCTCNCDGSWNCPGETAVDTCNTDPESGCRYCDVRGQREKGNTRFELQEGCIKYQCICECNGRWNCPAEHSINTCTTQAPTTCHNCMVNDKVFPGNSYFTHEDNCFRYQCTCHCDGGWNCPASSAVYICDRTTPAPACRHCIAKGQYFPGNSDFMLEEGCYRYSCRCKCDGGWQCPAHSAVNICDRTLADCNDCAVDGRRIPGNSSFMQTSECFKYECMCKCDGNWHCPADKAVNICHHTTPMTGCQQCNMKGVLYPGNSTFTYDEDCFRYQCSCKCDGSWYCPPETAVDSCHTSNRSLTDSSCLKCQVDDKVYPGNTNFQRDDGCFRSQCKCHCNGTWDCAPETIFNICNRDQSRRSCKKCQVGDTSYAGNTNFYHVDNCRKILCKCSCDGKYTCIEDSVIDICNGTTVKECTKCMVRGKSYVGNSDFTYQYGCYNYHCRCNCNGKATCPEDKAVDVCAAGILNKKLTPKCKLCKVHGRFYKGNTKFVLKRACFSYQCTCSCDGRWHCPSESAQDVCSTTPATVTVAPTNNTKCKRCKVKRQIFKGNTVFFQNNGCYRYRCKCNCDGSWECPTEEAVDICRGLDGRLPISDRQCVNCKVRGQLYKGGEDFDLLEACFKFRCHCDCSGKWKCPSEQPENVCVYETATSKPCQECQVKKQTYPGNSWFTYEQSCRRLQCQCRCSGTWHCPKHLTADICNINKNVRSDGVCKKCVVRGKSYAGDAYFSFDRGCLRFRCSCNCDGSWNCLAGRAVNICPGSTPEKKCKKCQIGKKILNGNETFEYVFGCKKYQCNCFCDGKFFCPGDKTEDICGHEKNSTEISTIQPSRSCNDCTIDGKTFPGNSNFRYTLNCFMYECDCGCDGTWSCPPERSVNICADKSETNCGQCIVNGRTYDGDIQFKRKLNCFEYTCTCHCNGTWECPTEDAQYVCDDDGNEHCINCVVAGHLYRGGTDVNITEGCQQHQCKCSCEGAWSCRTISDTCRHALHLGTGCTTCYVNEKFYNANSWFSTVEGCTEFRCRCNCDGTSTCHERLVRNICNNGTTPQITDSANTDSANKSQGCTVNGQTYYTKHFRYTDQCILYTCNCTNGSYICPAELSTTIC